MMTSKLSQMQARFQQKQMQEKEEKLLRLYESQQQRTIERVNRGSAGSISTSPIANNIIQGGRVRQMFDERRQKAGIDRSYPLEPLKITKSNGVNANVKLDNTRVVMKKTIKKETIQVKNGKPAVNKKEISNVVYNNNNGNETYEENHSVVDNLNKPVLNRTYKRRDLEMMMREHSINTNIDDEEFPDVNIEEFEEPSPKPKQNSGRSLPPEPIKEETPIPIKTPPKTIVRTNTTENSPKYETKTSAKKTIIKSARSSPSKESLPPKTCTPSTPTRSAAKRSTPSPTMSSKSCPQKSAESRTPTATRPSAKQSPRGQSAVTRDDLQSCRYCNRRFMEDRLVLHESICAKTLKKKRKVYDATKHRVEGTDLESYTRKSNKSMLQKSLPTSTIANSKSKRQQDAQSCKTVVKKNDWRKKHEEFIGAIRAAKMAQAHIAKGGKLSDLPPPPPSENPDYVQCPHCGRKFNQSAAERHIPKCSSYQFNKPRGSKVGKK
ncbi:hypothetical protein FQA39_LY16569 [Lamprigera yunnana]|nr:hypothetical protein FQA39_LY16569 [Lamprigera yunnana]